MTSAPPSHVERLSPPPAWHVLSLLVGGSVLLLTLPFVPALGATAIGLVAAALTSVLLVLTSPIVRVADGELRAGPARIPLGQLGRVETLDPAQATEALGPQLDARSYVCLRAWCRTAVRVEVTDPADPTPSWVVSTRRPAALAAAIEAGRA